MTQPEPNEIQKLLRLKKYEQPPPGYFDQFLNEFQRRQREEMLRQPIWRIALERVGAFFSDNAGSRLAYGAATAAVLVGAGLAALGIISTPGTRNDSIRLASSAKTAPSIVSSVAGTPAVAGAQAGQSLAASPPHYVIDARPVSYEPPFSF